MSRLLFIIFIGMSVLFGGCVQKILRPDTKHTPEFDTSVPQKPKVGLILGPGGSKALAHLGVLKTLEEQGIPIDAIVGYEWGALIGGLYAIKGKTNTVDWQLKKLKASHLPSKGLFTRRRGSESIDVMKDFLNKAFQEKKNSKSKTFFTCPTLNLKTNKIKWEYYGWLTDMLSRCMPFPPYFKPTKDWVAAPIDLKTAALRLRQRKVDIIIYVNVLAGKSIFKSNDYKNHFASYILWRELKRASREAKHYVDEVIDIPLRSTGLIDYNSHSSIIEFGKRKSLRDIRKLKTKYNLSSGY